MQNSTSYMCVYTCYSVDIIVTAMGLIEPFKRANRAFVRLWLVPTPPPNARGEGSLANVCVNVLFEQYNNKKISNVLQI